MAGTRLLAEDAMSLEPLAADRLHLVLQTTGDAELRRDLEDVRQDLRMPFQASPELVSQVRACARCRPDHLPLRRGMLCEFHRREWDRERCGAESERLGGSVEDLFGVVLRDAAVGVELLNAYRAQAAALNLVWEAHLRGAVRLPEAVAKSVAEARRQSPNFLAGGRAQTEIRMVVHKEAQRA